MTLKDRIKELCQKSHISVNQLEQNLGFSKGYIGHLGKSTPNSEYIKRMADYFDVSVDYLMTGEGDDEPLDFSELEKMLLDMYRRLDAVDKGYVMGYMAARLNKGDENDGR